MNFIAVLLILMVILDDAQRPDVSLFEWSSDLWDVVSESRPVAFILGARRAVRESRANKARQVTVWYRFVRFVAFLLSCGTFLLVLCAALYMTVDDLYGVDLIENRTITYPAAFWVQACFSIFSLICAMFALLRVVIVDAPSVIRECALETLYFAALLQPEVRFDLDPLRASQWSPEHPERVVNFGRPMATADDVHRFFTSARRFLLEWLSARRTHMNDVVNYYLSTISHVVMSMMLALLVSIAVVVARLISGDFDLRSLFEPASALLLYVGLFAGGVIAMMSLRLMRVLDNTDLQVRLLQRHASLCHARAGIYEVEQQAEEATADEFDRFGDLLKHLITVLENDEAEPRLFGIKVRRSHYGVALSAALAQIGTLLAIVLTSSMAA